MFPALRCACTRPAVSALRGNFCPQQSRNVFIKFQIPPPGGPRRYQKPRYEQFKSRKQRLQELWGNPGFRKLTAGAAVGSTAFYFYNTEVVPVSGRRRFNIISNAMEMQLAEQMYTETVEQFKRQILPKSHPTTKKVERVLNRLIPVSGLEDLNWEVFVIKDDKMKNAFVIPGGKVFVFSGILPICGGDDGLAAVMSHEIAHTVAHHSAERMSKSFLVIGAILLAGVTLGDPETVTRLGRILLDLVYLRPGSRKQEAEADYIGLMMMAQACYKPESAVTLWERMEQAQEFTVPQFLSTHPSNLKRIENIQKWMPEAKLKIEMSECTGVTLDYADEFIKAFEYPKW